MKTCIYCLTYKPETDFCRVNQSPKHTRDWCKDCQKKQRKLWSVKNERKAAKTPEYKARKKLWRKNNAVLRLAYNKGREAAKIKAMPVWANATKIADIYKFAQKLTKETGIQHDVDHEIPLRSTIVCGLHVEGNLRVITSEENNRKGNSFHA